MLLSAPIGCGTQLLGETKAYLLLAPEWSILAVEQLLLPKAMRVTGAEGIRKELVSNICLKL